MRAVVINMDRSPERLAAFRTQAESLGIEFERLAAVDAATIQARRGRLTTGEIACFESHRLAWKSLVQSGEPWLAVFEDDVILAPAVAPLLRQADWIAKGVDLIKLETFMARTKIAPAGIPVAGTCLHRLQATHCGSAGYIVSRRAAEWLLSRTQDFTRPVDIVLFDPEQATCRGIHILQAVPALCIQERFLSESVDRLPRHDGLIERSEVVETVALRGRAKRQHEVRRVWRQISRPRLLWQALRPSRRLVVPFQDR